MDKIAVGISSCLLGHEVRYNGGHKQSKFCLNHLSKVFEFHPFCPEVAIGLGVPREPVRIIDVDGAHRVVGTVNGSLDVTDALARYGEEIGRYSKALCGYILMKKSPSCGLFSAKVYRGEQSLPGKHAGIYARGLMNANPILPMEEEGRLNDPLLRENFITRVFAYNDWKACMSQGMSARKLIAFHSRYKYLLMAHGQSPYKKLGQMVSKAGEGDIDALTEAYIKEFMASITNLASRKGHTNTLYHLLGYLRDGVSGEIRQELAKNIEDYRLGIVNLAVPMALLNHYLKLYGSDYVKSQAYREPHSYDLGLRNTI